MQARFAPLPSKEQPLFLAVDPLVLSNKSEFYRQVSEHGFLPLFNNTRLNAYIEFSPILARLPYDSMLFNWFFRQGNSHLGICIASHLSLVKLEEHFKSFIFCKRYDDIDLLIRVYDPYIMHDIEYIFDQEEYIRLFKNINCMWYSGQDSISYVRNIYGELYE